ELGGRRRLARPELHAPTRETVERRYALGDACRVVERRRCLHDPVPEAEPRRALRQRPEEHLGRARVAVLLEEVVLDEPVGLDADALRELGLLERLAEHLALVALVPRPWHLVLVEQAELHRAASLAPRGPSPGR